MSLKVKFPVGAKLVVIITALFFLSLGLITLLVALFVGADVESTARINNINIDKMSSLMVEDKLSLIKSNSMVLLENISTIAGNNEGRALYMVPRMKNLFFSQNPDIAVIVNRGQAETLDPSFTNIVNDRFFL